MMPHTMTTATTPSTTSVVVDTPVDSVLVEDAALLAEDSAAAADTESETTSGVSLDLEAALVE